MQCPKSQSQWPTSIKMFNFSGRQLVNAISSNELSLYAHQTGKHSMSNNTYCWLRYRGKGHFTILLVEMCFIVAFLESDLAISIKLKISFDPDSTVGNYPRKTNASVVRVHVQGYCISVSLPKM